MVRSDRVAVVVDSAASLPAEVGEDVDLYVVPMRLTVEGRTYLDGQDLTPTEFYRMLKGTKEPPTTSSPSPAQFLDTFERAAETSSAIACLTVSPHFSSSYDCARAAAQDAKDALPQAQVTVVDTQSAAGGEGLVAMEVWRAAGRGAGLDEVVAAARAVIPRICLFAFLDTLYYLWKSGRVPVVAHAATSLLQIKPLFELSRGQVRNTARPRTSSRATERMLDLMRGRVPTGRPVHATVMHSDAGEAAEQLKRRIESEFPCEELFVSEFSPVMGTHTGPGLLGIAFWSEDTGGEGS